MQIEAVISALMTSKATTGDQMELTISITLPTTSLSIRKVETKQMARCCNAQARKSVKRRLLKNAALATWSTWIRTIPSTLQVFKGKCQTSQVCQIFLISHLTSCKWWSGTTWRWWSNTTITVKDFLSITLATKTETNRATVPALLLSLKCNNVAVLGSILLSSCLHHQLPSHGETRWECLSSLAMKELKISIVWTSILSRSWALCHPSKLAKSSGGTLNLIQVSRR